MAFLTSLDDSSSYPSSASFIGCEISHCGATSSSSKAVRKSHVHVQYQRARTVITGLQVAVQLHSV